MSLHEEHVNHAFIREEELSATHFHGLELGSTFQPIISLSHRRVVGHEALLRARTSEGKTVSPPIVFALAVDDRETVQLDRLCRVLHIHNYIADTPSETWLFLNVSATVVVEGRRYGAFFEKMLSASGFPAHRIVVEILEGAVSDETRLAAAAEYYRSLGCLVAIDDFGAGHSNFERIWRLRPDIVKLDRHIIATAVADARAMRMANNMVSMLHEAGSLVLVEGVETREQALAAMETDADFVQGYYFGRPAPVLVAPDPCDVLEPLCHDFHCRAPARFDAHSQTYIRFREPMTRVVTQLRTHESLRNACVELIRETGFRRAYLLDENGFQIDSNIEDPSPRDPRYAPLVNAHGASWFRRPYFRKAIARSGELQRTRPYLSITDAQMCITLSLAFDTNNGRRVLCCDLVLSDS